MKFLEKIPALIHFSVSVFMFLLAGAALAHQQHFSAFVFDMFFGVTNMVSGIQAVRGEK